MKRHLFAFRISATVVPNVPPSSLLPDRQDIWFFPSLFCGARFIVWAEHYICGDHPASLVHSPCCWQYLSPRDGDVWPTQLPFLHCFPQHLPSAPSLSTFPQLDSRLLSVIHGGYTPLVFHVMSSDRDTRYKLLLALDVNTSLLKAFHSAMLRSLLRFCTALQRG